MTMDLDVCWYSGERFCDQNVVRCGRTSVVNDGETNVECAVYLGGTGLHPTRGGALSLVNNLVYSEFFISLDMLVPN